MSSPMPATSSSLERLTARVERLVARPSVFMGPEGAAIACELFTVLNELADMKRRLAAVESAIARGILKDQECGYGD